MSDEPTFASTAEELDYWKETAIHLRQELDDLRAEFEDFQENSRDLEAELEASLEQTEAKNRELMSKVQRLEDENESVKTRLEAQQNESYVTISTLQAEKMELLQIKDSLIKYVRELEQMNDDLERGKRVTMTSLDDFDAKLNHALERNAILENELDEKEQLNIMCQRLKDEVRDLRSELIIKGSVQKADGDTEDSNSLSRSILSSQTTQNAVSIGLSTSPVVKATPVATPTHHHAMAQPQPITPSARISALNMVGELLRKVGALENRLASCKTNISKESMRHTARTTSPVDSPVINRRNHMSKLNGETPGATPHTASGNLTKITV